MIDTKKLVAAGVHFGHKKSRWHPRMKAYIWGVRSNTHLINVAKTAQQLEKASQFLESIAAEGKNIFWVGTKKQAQSIISKYASELKCPFAINRWIGGTFTNFGQVKKSRTKLAHLEDVLEKSANQAFYTKKEIVSLSKVVDRLRKNVGSIRDMTWPVGAVVVVDVKKEQTALKEAAMMGIPVVGIVDTNSDPLLVDHVIPANDDAPRSIELLVEYLAAAVARGKEVAAQKSLTPVDESAHDTEGESSPMISFSSGSEDEAGGADKRRARKAGAPRGDAAGSAPRQSRRPSAPRSNAPKRSK